MNNKTDHHDITEILLKVALNTIKQTNKQTDEQQIIDLFDLILWHQFHVWVSEWQLKKFLFLAIGPVVSEEKIFMGISNRVLC